MTRSRTSLGHSEPLRLPIIGIWDDPPANTAGLRRQASEKIVSRPLHIDCPIKFGIAGGSGRYVIARGWHPEEPLHRWTSADSSLFAFNALFDGSTHLFVDLLLLGERPWADYDLAITLNGVEMPVRRSEDIDAQIEVLIDRPPRPAAEVNILGFHSNTVVISELLGGSDHRRVGIGVRQLWFAAHA